MRRISAVCGGPISACDTRLEGRGVMLMVTVQPPKTM
jgi:hypothetical protein